MSARRAKARRLIAPPAPDAAPSLAHLYAHPALLHRIAGALIGQLSPLYDRRDLLRDAASLACAGSKASPTGTELARLLFKHLSPHLGKPLPGGITRYSPCEAVAAAAKMWGLKSSGAKIEVFERLMDEVEDSVRPPPRHCRVSAATRRELAGWRQLRISAGKAKELFGLKPSELDAALQYTLVTGKKSKEGEETTAKTYRLVEVKQLAVEVGRSRELVPQARPPRQGQAQPRAAGAAAGGASQKPVAGLQGRAAAAGAGLEARAAAVRGALLGRGHTPAKVELMTDLPGAFRVLEPGYPEARLPPEEAASHLERAFFCVRGPAAQHFMPALAAAAQWEPPPSSAPTARADAAQARRERAMKAALPQWVAAQRNLMFILGNPEVPRSMLPELQGLWEAQQAKQAKQAQRPQRAQRYG